MLSSGEYPLSDPFGQLWVIMGYHGKLWRSMGIEGRLWENYVISVIYDILLE